jgi:deazaflavin-dependent oxidoreductase (nitroreductase family)
MQRSVYARGMLKWALKIASTRLGGWFFITIAPPIDRLLLRLSGGRLSLGGTAPILLLETRGARSGEPRATPLLFAKDGERFVLVASKGGHPKHPAWYHNLRRHPDVHVLVGGRRISCRAAQADGAERARLWTIATDLNPGYDTYQARVTRQIPVMVLTPREP